MIFSSGGTGISSEQSTILLVSTPRTAIFWKAALNAVWIFCWLPVIDACVRSLRHKRLTNYVPTKDCHSQAVLESRASCGEWEVSVLYQREPAQLTSESDWRRSSPARGDSTSPWLPAVLCNKASSITLRGRGQRPVIPWEPCSAKLSLYEELRVEDLRSRVEGGPRDGGVHLIGSSDGVASI